MGRIFLPIAAATCVLFFPVRIETDAYADLQKRKLVFGVYLYGKIKIIGGYVTSYLGGFALHVKKNKAILLPYSRVEAERKRFSFVKSFRLEKLFVTTETGAEYMLPTGLAHTALKAVFYAYGGKKERSVLKIENGDRLNAAGCVVVRFNGYMLIRAFMKFVKEKVKYLWQKKKKKSTI